MNRDELLNNICPGCRTISCCNGDKSCNCSDCNRVLNKWLDDYDKQIRADAIDEFAIKLENAIQEDIDDDVINQWDKGTFMGCVKFVAEQIENNIAKANCDKLNIEEYEVEQKRIFKKIRTEAIDGFANWLVEQGILGSRCISDGEITDYGKVYAKRYKEQLKEQEK